jgi:type IV secretion system protein VirB4
VLNQRPVESLPAIHQRIVGDRRAMAELLAWLFPFNDRIVVNKDSGLMAAYEFTGPDTDSISSTAMLKMVNDVSHALKGSTRRPFNIWWIVHRRRISNYDTLPMPDPISQMIDDGRKAAFEKSSNYLNRHYFVPVMTPAVGLDGFAGRLSHSMNHDGMPIWKAMSEALMGTFADQYAFAYSDTQLAKEVIRFEELLAGMTSSTPDVKCRRLVGDAYGAFLHACASPTTGDQAAVEMDTAQFLDVSITENNIDVGHDTLLFDGGGKRRYGFATGIPSHRENWPDQVHPTLLDGLLKLQGELTICHMFRVSKRTDAEKHIRSMRRYHDNRRMDVRGVLSAGMNGGDTSGVRQNTARIKASSRTQGLLDDLSMGKKAYGWYAFNVISYSPMFRTDEEAPKALEAGLELVKAVDEVLRGAKWTPVQESHHLVSAFSLTLPGMWKENARWAWIDTDALARMLPLRTVSRGEPVNAYLSKEMNQRIPALAALPTDYGTPYSYTGFWGPLGHRLSVGKSRTGKTIFEALCWTLGRKIPNSQAYIVDKDYSNKIPILLQGGEYIDYTEDASKRATTNPLLLLEHDRHFEWVSNWIELLASMRGYKVTTADQQNLEKQLKAIQKLKDRSMWRLQTLYVQFPKGPFRDQLAPWVGEGIFAHYFDNVEDAFENAAKNPSRLVGMEVGKILTKVLVALPMLSYLIYRIEDGIDENRRRRIVAPTLISLPEVHQLLDNPMFEAMLDNWLKTLGKKLGQVAMDSQSPENYFNSKIFHSIRDNVPTRIFLPTDAQITPSLRAAYRDGFGLNDAQIDALSTNMVRQRDYFITQSDGFSRKLSVQLDTRSVAILRSELSAQALFDRIYETGDPNWKEQYLDAMIKQLEKNHG